ncbi:hypothetical protein MSG28_001746 [Choristoneura fumiferana]|nr:hypothetical protein MSG28_001746 [Choristoneura fumiferana]
MSFRALSWVRTGIPWSVTARRSTRAAGGDPPPALEEERLLLERSMAEAKKTLASEIPRAPSSFEDWVKFKEQTGIDIDIDFNERLNDGDATRAIERLESIERETLERLKQEAEMKEETYSCKSGGDIASVASFEVSSDCDNVKLHYLESGDPSKPLMIFLHGFPEFWCIAVDMRGYGDSERPDDVSAYHFDLLVEDVRDLIRQLGREKCILVAHDWGGLIACRLRDVHSDALDALIVLGSTSREAWWHAMWHDAVQKKMSWYVLFFRMPALPERFILMDDMAIFDKTIPAEEGSQDIECYKYWFGKPYALTPPINYYRANFNTNLHMSLTIQQIILDAKRLAGRLKERETESDALLTETQSAYRQIHTMKQYKEEVDTLNEASRERPRGALIASIERESRLMRDVQRENGELRAALEDHRRALELIMSKYRQHTEKRVWESRIDFTAAVNEKQQELIRKQAERINEMTSIMYKAVNMEENRGLREMLDLSRRYGSDRASAPPTEDKDVQTDGPPLTGA